MLLDQTYKETDRRVKTVFKLDLGSGGEEGSGHTEEEGREEGGRGENTEEKKEREEILGREREKDGDTEGEGRGH